MRIDSKIIRANFSKAAVGYDANSDMQKEIAAGLLRLLHETALTTRNVFPGGSVASSLRLILDIGCGTGCLVNLLKPLLPGAAFYGCDMARPMLSKAIENCGTIIATCADCERLPFLPASFDMVVSSLTYQWASDTKRAFKEAARVLRSGKVFAFSTLGPGTLYELRESYSEAVKIYSKETCYKDEGFQDTGKIEEHLKAAGLEVIGLENRPASKTYNDLFALLKTLKSIGANKRGETNSLANGTVLRETARIYSQRFPSPDNGIVATYDAIYAIARRR